MASKAEQRHQAMMLQNLDKPMFPVAHVEKANSAKSDSAHVLAGGKYSAKSTDDLSATHALIIDYIKAYAGKFGIVLTTDCIHGKTGVGEIGTKKRPGYGTQGQPGLLQKAMACVEMEKLSYLDKTDRETAARVPTGNYDSVVIGGVTRHIRRMEKIPVTLKSGKTIIRSKWKVIVEWEIKLMAARTKDRPLLRKMKRDKETGIRSPATGDGDYVGLVKVAPQCEIRGGSICPSNQVVAVRGL